MNSYVKFLKVNSLEYKVLSVFGNIKRILTMYVQHIAPQRLVLDIVFL